MSFHRYAVASVFAILASLVFMQPAASQNQVLCAGLVPTIVGTEGNDVLIGTNGRDVIAGLGGNDIIRALGGRDVVCGGDGRDRIDGGRQSDTLIGGNNGDLLKGGTGIDFLFGERGNDRLIGGNGDDELYGGRGNRDRLSGRNGVDICVDPKETTIAQSCEFELPELLDFAKASTFGDLSLEPGFEDDPQFVEVISGGEVDAAYLGEPCVGYASGAPDVEVEYGPGGVYLEFSFLSLFEEGEDTALIVNAPDGLFYCNDDFYGLDPAIGFENPLDGVYDIWIASIEPGEFIPGDLVITEFFPGE